MKSFIKRIAAIICIATTATTAFSQDKFTVNGNVDIVNNYVWRGLDQNSSFSIQPSMKLGYKGFSLSAWGSQSMTNSKVHDVQEFDINLGYTYKGLTVMVSDLWWGGLHNPYGYYKEGPADNRLDGGHHFEGTLSYYFGDKVPLTLSWSTWFAGADMRTDSGKRCFSSYISASYNIACPFDVTLTPSVGFTPWKGYYYNNAAFTDVSLKAARSIELSSRFSLPLFVQVIVSPIQDHVFFVSGAGIGF